MRGIKFRSVGESHKANWNMGFSDKIKSLPENN